MGNGGRIAQIAMNGGANAASLERGIFMHFRHYRWVAGCFTAVLMGAALSACASTSGVPKATFEIGKDSFLVNGQPYVIRCGEVHATRVPKEYWRNRLQMCRAMGLNTVCAYLFWNTIEPEPGVFTWEGRSDIAEFCRIAQEEGLWVILRPGPYACAEWEMGGLPWWLLKTEDIKVRSRDPRFLDAARRYFMEVGRELGPLQVTRGGPILMVQAENEYGFYGADSEYMGEIRQALIDAGFDVPLFACNPVSHLRDGYRDDLFPVVNFGSNPEEAFAELRRILPEGPLMCGEFYPGWFDTWGAPHHLGNEARYLGDLETMLKMNGSFSIYMAHGGSSFGLWAGADRPFKPDTSSYDYDAPISEAGWATPKFFKTRELMAKYLLPGETLPDVPANNPVMTLPEMKLEQCAPVFANLPRGFEAETPPAFESFDLAHGAAVYRTTLPAGGEAKLKAGQVHDFGFVYLDGELLGVMDRRSQRFEVKIPAREKDGQLDILVYALGRVNFGQEVLDRKGLHGPVELSAIGAPAQTLEGWTVFPLSLDGKPYEGLDFGDARNETPAPAFWRIEFDADKTEDTFLDMRGWGKGVLWINGECLGRFWAIGPTQTMYLPGPWLKKGKNEIVVLDLTGPRNPVLAGLEKPILDQLHPEYDFASERRAMGKFQLEGAAPVSAGSFPAGTAMQEVKFDAPASGRHFCIESLSAHGGGPFAAIAELDLLGAGGAPLSHEGWTIAYVDSEERSREDGTAENAIDGQTANFWHTQWGDAQPAHPHRLVIDLGKSQTLTGLRYTPRGGDRNVGGRIKDYKVYVGDSLVSKP